MSWRCGCQSQKLEAIGTLAIDHDSNNLLAAIVARSEELDPPGCGASRAGPGSAALIDLPAHASNDAGSNSGSRTRRPSKVARKALEARLGVEVGEAVFQ